MMVRHFFQKGDSSLVTLATEFAQRFNDLHTLGDGTRLMVRNLSSNRHIENAMLAFKHAGVCQPEKFADFLLAGPSSVLERLEATAKGFTAKERLNCYEFLDMAVVTYCNGQGYPDGYLAGNLELLQLGLSKEKIATINKRETVPTPEPAPAPEPEPETQVTSQPTQATTQATSHAMPSGSDPMGMFSQFLSGMVGQIVDSKVAEAESRLKMVGTTTTITLVKPEETVKLPAGTYHKLYEPVLKSVNAGMPFYLYGPAGTGKNVLCQQVADALGLKFYYTGALQDRYSLSGFIDANGTYQETEFYKAFTGGGLFMLDEMDASAPEALVALNGAIANKYFDFPNGRATAHQDFRVVGAGNTAGFGADDAYTGRNKIDYASIDRFFTMYMDYDPRVELAVAGGEQTLVDFVHALREAGKRLGLALPFGTRTIQQFRTAREANMGDSKFCMLGSFCKGLDKDSLRQLQGAMTLKNNKYAELFGYLEMEG